MQDAELEIGSSNITKPDGINKIIARLHKNHKKDELTQKYNALNALEPYWQKPTATIRDSLTEFEKRYQKIKSYGTTTSDDALACKLLKAGNLQTRNEKLVKAMITELKYDAVKTK